MDLIAGVLLALTTAVLQSAGYVVSGSYVRRTGLPGWTLAGPQQLLMTVPYALIAWAFRPTAADFDWAPVWGGALVCMVCGYCGHVGLFQTQKSVEPSRVSPLQTVKIPLIALGSFLFLGRTYASLQLLGIALVVVSAALLCGAGRRIPLSAWGWLLVCSAGYAACDVTIWGMLEGTREACGGVLGSSLFVMGVVQVAVGLLAVPVLVVQKASGVPFPSPRDWVRYALLFGTVTMAAMICLFLAFSLCGVVLGTIAQSSRGLISVVFGWFLARHGFADVEEPVARAVFLRRVFAAIVLIAAIACLSMG